MATALDIKIKRANKVYRCGEILSGVVVIISKDAVQHQGISLTMEGSVNLQLSAKSVGVFEAFYNSVKQHSDAKYIACLRSSSSIQELAAQLSCTHADSCCCYQEFMILVMEQGTDYAFQNMADCLVNFLMY